MNKILYCCYIACILLNTKTNCMHSTQRQRFEMIQNMHLNNKKSNNILKMIEEKKAYVASLYSEQNRMSRQSIPAPIYISTSTVLPSNSIQENNYTAEYKQSLYFITEGKYSEAISGLYKIFNSSEDSNNNEIIKSAILIDLIIEPAQILIENYNTTITELNTDINKKNKQKKNKQIQNKTYGKIPQKEAVKNIKEIQENICNFISKNDENNDKNMDAIQNAFSDLFRCLQLFGNKVQDAVYILQHISENNYISKYNYNYKSNIEYINLPPIIKDGLR